MIFVGSGALLSRAVNYCKQANLAVDVVCCTPQDRAMSRLQERGTLVLRTNNPNTDLLPVVKQCTDGVAFSINNKHILRDDLLSTGLGFFNVHNGLIQSYRGLAEVCIFAGLCKGERQYGVTLHRVLPGQGVDAGPVVAQQEFNIADGDGFSEVLERSLDACHEIFELNVGRILSNSYTEKVVRTSEVVYSYKDVARLCRETDPGRLSRVCNLGLHADFFPKLQSMIDSACRGSTSKLDRR